MLAKHKWQIKTLTVLERVFEERTRQVAQYGHNEEIEDGFGPTHTSPASITACANSAFSERKP